MRRQLYTGRLSVGRAQPRIRTKSCRQKAGRVLITHIEEIIDAAKRREIFADFVIHCEIDNRVAGRGEPLNREIAIAVDEAADKNERRRE
jgi:hypothetical protein